MTEHLKEERICELPDVEAHTVSFQTCGATIPVREHIVRCRDCKHYRDRECYNVYYAPADAKHVCHFWQVMPPVYVEPDGFCKWGEPREV